MPPEKELFAIFCDGEGMIFSSKIERPAWQALEKLVAVLDESSSKATMFGWKSQGYQATARDTYAWRRAIDAIKEADLSLLASKIQNPGEGAPLMKSKPIMLRVTGEVTNALIHSYQNQHKIRFIQIDSVEPSGRAT
jgi:hypothetical protein